MISRLMEMNDRKESHDLQAPSSNMLRTHGGAQVTKHHEILARKLGTAIPPNELGNAKFPRMQARWASSSVGEQLCTSMQWKGTWRW
jgi:hypothetical protein